MKKFSSECLTIGVCVYNAAKTVERTLDSIAAQNMPGFKLFVVNDCSTDNSAQIVEAWLANHPDISSELISLPKNEGLPYGRQVIVNETDTRYVMFVDADDTIVENAVELMLGKALSDSSLMGVGCYLDYVDPNGKKIGGGIYLGDTDKQSFFERAAKGKLIFMQSTAVIDRDALLKVGGYNLSGFPDGKPRYRDYCEDLDMWTRMSDLYTEGRAFVVVPEVLCHYTKAGTGLSASSLPMVLRMKHVKTNVKRRRAGMANLTFIEFLDSLSKKEYNKIERGAKSADALRNGVFYMRKGRVLRGMWQLMKSFCYNPSYIPDKIRHNLLGRK